MDAVDISQWISEEEAAAEQNLALLMFLHYLRAERNNVSDKGIVVFLGKAVQPQAGVNDQLQNLLLQLCIGNLLFIQSETFNCCFIGILVVEFRLINLVDQKEQFKV